MSEQTNVTTAAPKIKVLKVALLVGGVLASVILFVFVRDLYEKHLYEDNKRHIEQMQELSDSELEEKAQSGNPYAKYALGERIYDTVSRWKAGAKSRKECKPYEYTDIWIGDTAEVEEARKRLYKLASEGNDYARYSLEEYINFQESQRVGSERKTARPLKDYRLIDYSGQLLLAAMESAIENKMHRDFVRRVAGKLSTWTMMRLFFRSPINKNPEFVCRWKAVRERIVKEGIAYHIPNEP